jgi:hypothetical protein
LDLLHRTALILACQTVIVVPCFVTLSGMKIKKKEIYTCIMHESCLFSYFLTDSCMSSFGLFFLFTSGMYFALFLHNICRVVVRCMWHNEIINLNSFRPKNKRK